MSGTRNLAAKTLLKRFNYHSGRVLATCLQAAPNQACSLPSLLDTNRDSPCRAVICKRARRMAISPWKKVTNWRARNSPSTTSIATRSSAWHWSARRNARVREPPDGMRPRGRARGNAGSIRPRGMATRSWSVLALPLTLACRTQTCSLRFSCPSPILALASSLQVRPLSHSLCNWSCSRFAVGRRVRSRTLARCARAVVAAFLGLHAAAVATVRTEGQEGE